MEPDESGTKAAPFGSVPQHWDVLPLDSVSAHITKGATPTTFGFSWESDGVPFLRSECVREGRFDWTGSEFISQLAHAVMSRSGIRAGDLLMTITGYIGRTCRYPDGAPEANINQHIARIRIVDHDRIDSRFAMWALQDPRQRNLLQRDLTGLAYPQISLAQVQQIPLPVPPLPEQRQIAEILDTLDEAIRKTEAIIAKLNQMKQGLLHDLLTRGIDDNGELRDAERHPEQFKNSPLGYVPRGWSVGPLGVLADLSVGYAFKSDWFSESEGVRLLRGENVGYGSPDWSQTKRLPHRHAGRYDEYLLSAGDVIIGMDRTFTKSGVKVSVVGAGDVPALLVQRVGRFVPLEGNSRRFMLHLLRWPAFHRELLAQQKGMDIPHLSKSEILSPIVPVPPPAEQSAIAEKLDVADSRLQAEHCVCEQFRSIKTGLMEDLLTGRVRTLAGDDGACNDR